MGRRGRSQGEPGQGLLGLLLAFGCGWVTGPRPGEGCGRDVCLCESFTGTWPGNINPAASLLSGLRVTGFLYLDFQFQVAVSLASLHQRISRDEQRPPATNTNNDNTYIRPRLLGSLLNRLSKPPTNNPSHHHVSHIHHVRTLVQANLLVLAPDQAVLARTEPASLASHQHHLSTLLLSPVLALREALYGQRPRRAPDTPDVSLQLALDVPLGSLFSRNWRA